MKTYTEAQARNLTPRNFAATATDGTAVVVKAYLMENALRKAREYDQDIETVYRWHAPHGGSCCDEIIEVYPEEFEVAYRRD